MRAKRSPDHSPLLRGEGYRVSYLTMYKPERTENPRIAAAVQFLTNVIGRYSVATVWLKWIAHLAVGILLLHHYVSDLAHLSDLYSSVIGLYKSEK